MLFRLAYLVSPTVPLDSLSILLPITAIRFRNMHFSRQPALQVAITSFQCFDRTHSSSYTAFSSLYAFALVCRPLFISDAVSMLIPDPKMVQSFIAAFWRSLKLFPPWPSSS